MPRPTKLTPETSEAILTALSIGATYKDAAEAAGVWYETFNDWMKRGEAESSGKFYQFYQSVRQTEAQARLMYLGVLENAASNGEWRAALEYLKRRDRSNWGDNVDVTTGGKPLNWKEFINGNPDPGTDSE